MGKYWYKIYHYWCPVCLRETVVRVRQYGPKPENCHVRVTDYDWCDAL